MFTQQATSMNSAVYDNEAIIYTSRDSVINRFFADIQLEFLLLMVPGQRYGNCTYQLDSLRVSHKLCREVRKLRNVFISRSRCVISMRRSPITVSGLVGGRARLCLVNTLCGAPICSIFRSTKCPSAPDNCGTWASRMMRCKAIPTHTMSTVSNGNASLQTSKINGSCRHTVCQ